MIRTTKPKLSVSISAAQSTLSQRPSLSLNLKSPGLQIHSPRSPLPPSPAAPKRFSTLQIPSSSSSQQVSMPSYNYVNSCSSKSILKKQTGAVASANKKIQFSGETVHCITPIENSEEYYGSYRKLTREERRWIVRNE
ncbi:hypothetical protein BJX70DRAFT_401214 [Aspergillus crustosus]